MGSSRLKRGQTTIEYTLIIALVSIVFSYFLWYAFMHREPGQRTRLEAFLAAVLDFLYW